MPHFAASDLGLHYLPITICRVSRLKWVNVLMQFVPVFFVMIKVSQDHQRSKKSGGDHTDYIGDTPQPLYNTIIGVHSINRVS